MPDLITHVAAAHLLKRPFEIRDPSRNHAPVRTIFYLGAMLPDLLSRPWYILFPPVQDWVVAFHTPFGMLLTCGLLTLLFERNLRGKVFLWLMAGVLLHFGMDCLQKQVTGNNFWLFPFSWRNFGYGLFWAGEAVTFMPVWIALVALMEGIFFLKKHKSNRSIHDSRK
jgi:hypothetical protein